ncbi:MAG: hypothetical protein EON91_08310 [Brevundimonas sp.]|uniref:hypothetical protein n=1 Tax=Brevundimonas sp. TaxID=1871086 RepID=UPI001221EFFA|nr:hypothetical protein [Brevundimonas sp.]RZJ17683.1 MAG: hypothetical protein EON91_08310 [Brevundimonas sp.]
MRVSALTALALMASSLTLPAMALDSQAAPSSQRAVMICATDAATRSSFAREYGQAPVYITAREALTAKDLGQTWSTPRCMTEREHARYLHLSQSMAAR